MKDTIYRQAAIDAINTYFGFNIEEEYGSTVQEVVNGLPSAEPERKTGKWKPWKAYYGKDHKSWSDELKCSECGYKWGDEEYKFCPMCGAKMEGEER